jgi:RNA ligase (TIGR02306 family)
MRKLASIQKMIALEAIPDADSILKATVLGWELVVRKGEFEVGDLVVYCEIDSILPDRPEFEMIRNRSNRIKTIRLRGQVSQGICFPLSILPADFVVEIGADCTEALSIEKYEPPIPAQLAGQVKGMFPSFIKKTDETRIQILQDVLDEYENEKCLVTEKLDGSSATYFIKDNVFGVCSRNLELIEDAENSFWKVARQMDIENKLRSMQKNIAIQGELIGEGLQKNRYKIKGQTVRFFNAFDIDSYNHYSIQNLIELMKALDLPMVPIVEKDYLLCNSIETLVKKATIKSTLNEAMWAEGIVIRPLQDKDNSRNAKRLCGNDRVSFKSINPEFLLSTKD